MANEFEIADEPCEDEDIIVIHLGRVLSELEYNAVVDSIVKMLNKDSRINRTNCRVDGLPDVANNEGFGRESGAISARGSAPEFTLVRAVYATAVPSDPVPCGVLQDSGKVRSWLYQEFDYTGSAAAWEKRGVEPMSPGLYAGT